MIKVSLVLLAGLSASALLRRRSAALRHCVLAASVVGAASTPLVSAVAPEWRLPVASFGIAGDGPLTLLAPLRVVDHTTAAGVAGDRASALPATRLDRAATLLVWAWSAGAAAGLSMLVVGLLRLMLIARRTRTVSDGPWAALASAISRRYGLTRPVALLESDHPTLLATWGLAAPKVILPRAALSWPAERIRIVLGHELAHVRRRDWIVQLGAEMLRAVYWFNPLAWIVCHRLRQESEQACDDAVLELGVEGDEYATHLLELARAFSGQRAPMIPAPAMARPSSLERRVRGMLNERLDRAPISRASAAAIAVALVVVTVTVAGAVLSAQGGNASFSGQLLDAIGKILPDTAVILSSSEGRQTLKTTSDASGQFSFPSVPPGDYQMQTERPGFASGQGRVTLGAGQRVTRDVVLQVGRLEETISIVSSDTPVVPRSGRSAVEGPNDSAYDRCSQSVVGGCITQPMKLRDQKPIYPSSKAAAGIGGLVVLDARIGTDGFMKDFKVVSGDAEFANATIAACQGWQFSQTRLDGVPVEVEMKVTARYSVE